ncbi:hypothetical protein [Chelatococcus sp. XZ-Ab1]|uniref:hypothetical protein n=1 Tax=Chelatococcus sp. XZ-Ab1 TaxID=3034027 RepID=UPI0023E3624C|nr:hypothetical protein [Chelatococcus sp. XZ-Ab1]
MSLRDVMQRVSASENEDDAKMLATIINADVSVRTTLTGRGHFEPTDVLRLGTVVALYKGLNPLGTEFDRYARAGSTPKGEGRPTIQAHVPAPQGGTL